MISSKHFVINDGPNAGIYCSYCGEKLTPQKDEETGAFYYQCTCADAKAEIHLLTQKEELDAKVEKFYAQREKKMKRIQLLAHRANMELQMHELSEALAELNDDESDQEESDEIPAPKHSPRQQVEEMEGNSLKMDGPKLPKFEKEE